jgi:hypothetical protein
MGIKTPDLPDTPADEILAMPFWERTRLLATHWVEWGFGGPKAMHLLYVFKLIFYVCVGFAIAWLTADLGSLSEAGAWWKEPIFYQKLLVWTVFFEIFGLGSSSGPLAFKFSPMIGGFLYLGRTKTLRIAPWPDKVPFTSGDHRTVWDVAVYWLLIADLVFLLAIPGSDTDRVPGSEAGLLPAWAVLAACGLILLGGLRDKLMYLMSRSEQYLVPMAVFALLSMPDLVIALKVAIVAIWVGASISKIGRHFTNVVPPMISNTPWITSRRLKRAHYRDFPNDLRPSRLASFMAHVTGTIAELVMPLVLLFSPWPWLTLVAVVSMLLFHAFITSTFPLAVPLEWNIFFMFAVVWLFWAHPVGDGFGVGDADPLVLAGVVFISVIFPIIGNLRPDWVSFLPSMRQYAGNWASATWAFRDREKEERLNQHVVKASKNQIDQLVAAGFPEPLAEMFLHKAVAWRTLHSQGRALLSLIQRHSDIESYVVREAEFVCNSLIGWNFGDGHLHDERLINAVQARCAFEPGDLVVAFTESQPIHRNYIDYRVIDAALGVVERGTYVVKDATDELPWLPNGPIRHQVTWQLEGYRAPYDVLHGVGPRGIGTPGAGATPAPPPQSSATPATA